MSMNTESDFEGNSSRSSRDVIVYLAAILPELALIARKSGIDGLCEQIDQAAKIATKLLVRPGH